MGVQWVFVLAVLVGVVCGNPLPVEKCSFSDSKCMIKAFQDAIPVFVNGLQEPKTDVLDVLEMDDIEFDLAGLKFTLKDGTLKGLKTSVIDKVKWNMEKSYLDFRYHVNCTVKGHYTAGGRVLILPITGDGQLKLKMKNLVVSLHIPFERKKGDDGKEYIIPKKYSFDYEVIDSAHFDLKNLFNGNKDLGDAMLRFLNDNWKEVTGEFGRPIMDVAAKKIFKNVVKYLSVMPIEDIALD